VQLVLLKPLLLGNAGSLPIHSPLHPFSWSSSGQVPLQEQEGIIKPLPLLNSFC